MKNQLTQTLQAQKKTIAVFNGAKSAKHGMRFSTEACTLSF
jgi:hypothetical protein